MTLDGSSLPTVATPPPEQGSSSLDRRNPPSQAEARPPDPGREPRPNHLETPHVLLQRSPYSEDQDGLIGRDPRKIPLADWRAASVELSGVMQAIRAKCLDCCGDQPGEVRKCVAVTCPIWPFRMGVDVFHGKRARRGKQAGSLALSVGMGHLAEPTSVRAGGRVALRALEARTHRAPQ